MVATTAQKSTMSMMDNQARYRKAVDGVWKIAKKSPMFSCIKKGSTGKEYTQYTRLINPNAYKVGVSGACAAVAGELEIDMKHLGMDFTGDSKTRPWACTVAPAAAFMLEQWLSTIVQQILTQNKTIREGLQHHKRNHKLVTQLSIDEVRQSIFFPAMGVPAYTTALPMSISKKGKKGEEESAGEKEFEAGAPAAEEDEDDAEEAEEGDDEA